MHIIYIYMLDEDSGQLEAIDITKISKLYWLHYQSN